MTRESLQAMSRKDLGEMARTRGITGWHELKKNELITKILRRAAREAKAPTARSAAKITPRPTAKTVRPRAKAVSTNGSHHASAAAARAPEPTADRRDPAQARTLPAGYGKDRIVVMVRDPFWLHAYWELTEQSIQRAEAALGQDWHTARPILRVVDVSAHDTTSTSEAIVKDVDIHGGCQNWYIEVVQPPRSYRVDVGYLSRRGQFFVLARSNVVTTPKAGASDSLDENWSDIDIKQADRIFAMSNGYDSNNPNNQELKKLLEERLRRPIGSPTLAAFGPGAVPPDKVKKFGFKLDAELIVYGETTPNARVTLQGEPVKLRPDGSFTMRFSLPDSRQIIPAVAVSGDGVQEQTIVLAIERNTKHLEPTINELDDEY